MSKLGDAVLKIVCDSNIALTPGLRALSPDILQLPGRGITRDHLQHCDILLVRSITRVDTELVKGTPVRFVGTATAGTDHIDVPALAELGIPVAAAPGANANAVAEYVMTAIAASGRLPDVMGGLSVGVVGYGAVGQRVATLLLALGARPTVWDPWQVVPSQLAAADLESALSQSVVTLHASLHNTPPWPSRHLVSQHLVERIVAPQLLINAGRGGLIPRSALDGLVERGSQLVLDTWPDEPAIDEQLLAHTLIATPHIAGYSELAKELATEQLVGALQRSGLMAEQPPVETSCVRTFDATAIDLRQADWCEQLLLQHYPIIEDDRALRACANPGVMAADFDRLRAHYPLRGELRGTQLTLSGMPTIAQQQVLCGLGTQWR